MYFIESDETKCPKYENCRSRIGKNFSPEYPGMCTRYKCNTYYQIDTLEIYNRIYDYLDKHSIETSGRGDSIFGVNNHRLETDIARIVEQAVQEDLRRLGNI